MKTLSQYTMLIVSGMTTHSQAFIQNATLPAIVGNRAKGAVKQSIVGKRAKWCDVKQL